MSKEIDKEGFIMPMLSHIRLTPNENHMQATLESASRVLGNGFFSYEQRVDIVLKNVNRMLEIIFTPYNSCDRLSMLNKSIGKASYEISFLLREIEAAVEKGGLHHEKR